MINIYIKKNPKRINDEMVKRVEFNEKNAILICLNIFFLRNQKKMDELKRFDYKKWK